MFFTFAKVLVIYGQVVFVIFEVLTYVWNFLISQFFFVFVLESVGLAVLGELNTLSAVLTTSLCSFVGLPFSV